MFWKAGLTSRSHYLQRSCLHLLFSRLTEMRHHLHFHLWKLYSLFTHHFFHDRALRSHLSIKWVKSQSAAQVRQVLSRMPGWSSGSTGTSLEETPAGGWAVLGISKLCNTSLVLLWGLCTDTELSELWEGGHAVLLPSLGLSAHSMAQPRASSCGEMAETSPWIPCIPRCRALKGFLLVLKQCPAICGMVKHARKDRQAACTGHQLSGRALLRSLNPSTGIPWTTFWASCASSGSSLCWDTQIQSQLISGTAAQATAACLGGCWTAVSAMTQLLLDFKRDLFLSWIHGDCFIKARAGC